MARFEWVDAVRSRRAVVVLALYLAAALLGMNGSITLLGKIEAQLAEVLQLPSDASRGVISTTLWQSKRFQRLVRSSVGDSLVYDDIRGRHPAELLAAWFAFFYVPILTVLVAGNRAADDLHSGSVRYLITRVTRLEWSLGKYLGLSALLLCALLAGGLAAWAAAALRLSGSGVLALLPAMLGWSVKAWCASLAWLGLAFGLSHLVQSGAKALALGTVAVFVWSVAPPLIGRFAGSAAVLARLFPGGVDGALWRAAPLPVLCAALWLFALGLLYLFAGAAVFLRRDAR
jgi:ABC-type transport system involved in multi-copper enzyme maturation permease subunit